MCKPNINRGRFDKRKDNIRGRSRRILNCVIKLGGKPNKESYGYVFYDVCFRWSRTPDDAIFQNGAPVVPGNNGIVNNSLFACLTCIQWTNAILYGVPQLESVD